MMKNGAGLSESDLNGVSGGYVETFGFAKGSDIKCPNCKVEDKKNFDVFLNLDTGMNDYTCKSCGYKFSLD